MACNKVKQKSKEFFCTTHTQAHLSVRTASETEVNERGKAITATAKKLMISSHADNNSNI